MSCERIRLTSLTHKPKEDPTRIGCHNYCLAGLLNRTVSRKNYLQNNFLSFTIQTRQNIIQNENRRIRIERPCKCLDKLCYSVLIERYEWKTYDTHLLPTTQSRSTNTNFGLITHRKLLKVDLQSAGLNNPVVPSSSHGDAPTIFSWRVPNVIHGDWLQYAALVKLVEIEPEHSGISPMRVFKKVDFPHPTGPTIIVIFEAWISMFKSLNTGSSSIDQAADKFRMTAQGSLFWLWVKESTSIRGATLC